MVGTLGYERLAPNGSHEVDPRVAAWGPALREAAAALAAVGADVPGAWVEDKGWSLSVHFRQVAPEAAPRVAEAARAAAARFGLRAGDGKQVVELRAPVAVDKGTAAVALARALGADGPGGAVLAAGDDVTDEDLFRRARAELPQAVTVRVGAPGVATAAEYRATDPPGVAALLEALLAARSSGA